MEPLPRVQLGAPTPGKQRARPWCRVRARKWNLEIPRQPDLATCGPTCLHAVYQYFEDPVPLADVVREVRSLEGGGTLGVLLACHALERGYGATLYTYNLRIFDPT